MNCAKNAHGIKSKPFRPCKLTIEETYELSDAIVSNDWKGIKKSWEIYFAFGILFKNWQRKQEQFEIEDVLNGQFAKN